MLERHLLLDTTGAVLLGCLAWHHPRLARHSGRTGLACYVAGTALPWLDSALFHFTTTDRIDLLSQPALFSAPLPGLLLVAVVAGLAAVLLPRRPVLIAAGLFAAGFAVHVALAVLTPVGWPLLAPFSSARVSLPMLPVGHPLLLLGLFVTLVAAEGLARWRRWIAPAAATLAGLYALAGAVQYGVVSWRARTLAEPGTQVHVYPDDAWLVHWEVVSEGPESYALRRTRVIDPVLPEPRVSPRWNDQALFLKLLGDPVVNRFYFRVFHYPVVRLEVSGSQITLLMQEVQDLSPPVPGPTFYLESDLTGRKRFYQLQRFN